MVIHPHLWVCIPYMYGRCYTRQNQCLRWQINHLSDECVWVWVWVWVCVCVCVSVSVCECVSLCVCECVSVAYSDITTECCVWFQVRCRTGRYYCTSWFLCCCSSWWCCCTSAITRCLRSSRTPSTQPFNSRITFRRYRTFILCYLLQIHLILYGFKYIWCISGQFLHFSSYV